jgi:tetratricopeptide (TPR) repeat protein
MIKRDGSIEPLAHDRLVGALRMDNGFLNRQRQSPAVAAQFQQLAAQTSQSQPAVDVRELATKRGKPVERGIDGLAACPAAKCGGSWTLLVVVAALLAVAVAVGLALFPSSKTLDERAPTATQRQSDARPRAMPVEEDGHDHTEIPHAEVRSTEAPVADAQQLLQRVDQAARAGQWQQAAEHFAAALRANPNEHYQWFRAATLLAWTNDRSAFRQHCEEMLRRFADPTEPFIAERSAKVCLLMPDGLADIAPAVKLAEQAVKATEHPYYRYFLMARGLAHYRAGEYAQAIDQTGKAVVAEARFWGLNVPAHLVAAMSHHRLGQAEEARKAFGQAREMMEQEEFPKLESGDVGAGWHDWLICQILRREAEALLEAGKGEAGKAQ